MNGRVRVLSSRRRPFAVSYAVMRGSRVVATNLTWRMAMKVAHIAARASR